MRLEIGGMQIVFPGVVTSKFHQGLIDALLSDNGNGTAPFDLGPFVEYETGRQPKLTVLTGSFAGKSITALPESLSGDYKSNSDTGSQSEVHPHVYGTLVGVQNSHSTSFDLGLIGGSERSILEIEIRKDQELGNPGDVVSVPLPFTHGGRIERQLLAALFLNRHVSFVASEQEQVFRASWNHKGWDRVFEYRKGVNGNLAYAGSYPPCIEEGRSLPEFVHFYGTGPVIRGTH